MRSYGIYILSRTNKPPRRQGFVLFAQSSEDALEQFGNHTNQRYILKREPVYEDGYQTVLYLTTVVGVRRYMAWEVDGPTGREYDQINRIVDLSRISVITFNH